MYISDNLKFHNATTTCNRRFNFISVVPVLDKTNWHTLRTYVTKAKDIFYDHDVLPREDMKCLRYNYYVVTGVTHQQRNNTKCVFIKCAIYLNFKLQDVYILSVLHKCNILLSPTKTRLNILLITIYETFFFISSSWVFLSI